MAVNHDAVGSNPTGGVLPEWWNWQTRPIQDRIKLWVRVPPWVRFRGGIGIRTGLKILGQLDCGFKSHRKHFIAVAERVDADCMKSEAVSGTTKLSQCHARFKSLPAIKMGA